MQHATTTSDNFKSEEVLSRQSGKQQQQKNRRSPLQRSIAFRASFLKDDLDTIIDVGNGVGNVPASGSCVVDDDDDDVFDEGKNTALVRAVDASFHCGRSSILRRGVSCETTISSSSPTNVLDDDPYDTCPHRAAERAAILVQ